MLRRSICAAALVACGALPAGAAAHGPPKITAGPPASTTDRGATFIFTYDEPAPTQSFECSLDGAAFAACTDAELPDGHQVYESLAPGAHVFRVRRVSQIDGDPFGDPTPAERGWTIEAPAAAAPAPAPEQPAPEAGPAPEGVTELEAPPGRPVPCRGVVQITDPAADSHHANPDVLRAWLRRDAGHSAVAIEVSDLGPAIDHEENQRVFWRLLFTAPDGTRRYVDAVVARGETTATYSYGRADGLNTTREGETTGALFTGKPGIVQIALPDELAPAGGTIREPVVVSGEDSDALGTSYFDRAPGGDDPTDPGETSVGADWRVAACETSGGTTSGAPEPGADGPVQAAASVQGIQLAVTRIAVRYGALARVAGRTLGAGAGTPVELVSANGATVARGTTGPDGAFVLAFTPRRTTAVRVRAGGLSSATVPVTVRSIVRLAHPRRVRGGLRFAGTVVPRAAGTVEIQQRVDGDWIVVGETRVRAGRFAAVVRGAQAGAYRAVVSQRAGDPPVGTSAVWKLGRPAAAKERRRARASHAAVASTSPRAGARVPRALRVVSVTFKAAVTTGTIVVRDAAGRAVSRGQGRLVGGKRVLRTSVSGLRRGRYTVRWRALAADGHSQKDTYSFRVS